MSGFLILSDETMEGLGIGPAEVADAIEDAIRGRLAGHVRTSPKASILPGDGRYMMSTLATGDAPGGTVLKTVMVSPRNPGRGLPSIDGAIIVLDSETGALRAVMQAAWITAVRTAGMTAVVARRVANPAAARVAFIGAGVQARSHLDAFAAMFPLSEIAVWSRGQANIDRLCGKAEAMGLAASVCESPEAAMAGADLVVASITLDYAAEPLLDARWLKPGAFASITDAGLSWRPDGMASLGTIVVDDLEQERANPKPVVDFASVAGDMAGLVGGTCAAAFDPAAPAAFVFRGQAIGDYAIACLALDRADAAGLGRAAEW